MDYITIATTGNSADFGDLGETLSGGATCMSDTRGVYMGGHTGSAAVDTILYITMATLGDAADFGDLVQGNVYSVPAGCSNGTRGIFGGGIPTQDVIDYVNIGTIGNPTDFGNLTEARHGLAAISDGSRGNVSVVGLLFIIPQTEVSREV